MGKPDEIYMIHPSRIGDAFGAQQDLTEQINKEFLRISEKFSDKAASGRLIDRGDPSGWDFEDADLITDGAWHDLNFSSIVPAGAIMIKLHIRVKDDAINSFIRFKKNGNTYAVSRSEIRTQVVDQYVHADIDVFCDANRVIEYITTNTAFTDIDIVVKGWILE